MTPHDPTIRPDVRPLQGQQRGRAVVVGLGRTGLSCARYLQSRGLDFAVTDSRAAPPESSALEQLAPEAEVRFGGFDESLLDGASQVAQRGDRRSSGHRRDPIRPLDS